MRVLTFNDSNVVISIKNVTEGYQLQKNEIESELGELGQIKQEDGTFIDTEPPQAKPETTLEDKINFIYYKQMGVL